MVAKAGHLLAASRERNALDALKRIKTDLELEDLASDLTEVCSVLTLLDFLSISISSTAARFLKTVSLPGED